MAISSFGDSDDDAVTVAQAPARAVSSFGDEADDEPVQAQPGVQRVGRHQLPQAITQDSRATAIGDIGRGLLRGTGAAAQGVVGIADILSGGAAGRAAEASGYYSPREADARLNQQDTPELQQARRELEQAQGFGPTLGVLAQNPRLIAEQAAQALPSMLLGGAAGRGVVAAGQLAGRAVPAIAAAGIGEGAVAAGQQAEQTRQQTGTLTPGQAGLAVGAGALTGLLGAAGARLGRAAGISDIDQQLAGVNGANVARGLVNRVLAGTGIESLEEMSQSSQEQVLANIAQGREPLAGVGQSAALGGAVGGIMGGAAGARRPAVGQPVQAPGLVTQQPVQQAQASAPAADLGQAMAQVAAAPQIAASAPAAPAAAPIAPAAQPAPRPAVPFAASQDISPLLDNLGVQGEQRTQTLDLLRPSEAEIEARRRGVVSLDEQRKLADLIGLEGAKAQSYARQIGQAWNAEQLIASTDLVRDRLNTVLQQQQRIATGTATDMERAQFVTDIGELKSVFGELAGARAESGRALAAQRKTIGNFQQARNILEGIGGAQGADDLATAIGKAIQSGGLKNAAKLIANRKPGLFDYYYRAALLSGVRTHAVNILSNTATLGNEIIERGIAAGIGGAKRLATGGKSGQTVFAEPIDLLHGMVTGTTKAARAAVDAFRTGESPLLGVGKVETGVGIQPKQSPVEKAFSLPYRALGAEDAWFGQLNYQAELRTLARQQALSEKKLGQLPAGAKLSQRIEQLVQDPTPQMIESAGEHARTQTFNTQAGAFASAIMSAKAKQPWLNVIVPFVRTPANIVNFALKRTPAAPLYSQVREDLKAGGAKQERAIARMLWGSSVMVGAGLLANAGYITGGGPEDEKERAALMATGWRPYSIKIGDTYHEYNRMDPFAMWLGTASDLATKDWKNKDAGDTAASLVSSFANNVINKTWMQGLSDFSEFLSDPKRNGDWYLKRLGGTLAQPFTFLSNLASERDPYARETNSLADAIQYRLPGLRESLPERLDALGEPVPNRTYPGGPASIAAPIATSQETQDPVRLEAGRLGWSPSKPQTYIKPKGKAQIDLSDAQYHDLQQLTGRLIHRGAQKLMAAPAWKKLSDDARRDALDLLASKSRTAVRLALTTSLVGGNDAPLQQLRQLLNGGTTQ